MLDRANALLSGGIDFTTPETSFTLFPVPVAEPDQRPCPQESLLATVKRRDLAWFRHVTHHDSLSKTSCPETGSCMVQACHTPRQPLQNQLSRDGVLHGSGMSHATTASPKPAVKRRGLAWFRLVTHHDSLSKTSCHETGSCMVQACHTPRQPLQNHPARHLGGWATPWSAEEMLDEQRHRVDIPAHARTAHKGLMQERLEEDLC